MMILIMNGANLCVIILNDEMDNYIRLRIAAVFGSTLLGRDGIKVKCVTNLFKIYTLSYHRYRIEELFQEPVYLPANNLWAASISFPTNNATYIYLDEISNKLKMEWTFGMHWSSCSLLLQFYISISFEAVIFYYVFIFFSWCGIKETYFHM